MSNYQSLLQADPQDWLLEDSSPSIRYFALRDLLGKPECDEEVQKARELIMQRGIVPDMLREMQDQEYKDSFPKFYTRKYQGLVWSLIVLAEMGASKTPQIQEGCEYLLQHSQEATEGGFSQNTAKLMGGGRLSEVIPCLTGNMVWCLIHFGYLDDPRLQKSIDWINQYMRFNDGIMTEPQSAPYDKLDMCWGKHTCHMAIVKVLKALQVVPATQRTRETNRTIAKAIDFMLIHHIYKRSHDLKRKSKPGWLRFGFPLMYQTDVLEVLDVLIKLGVKDSRMDDAIHLVLSRQDEYGRWKLKNDYSNTRLLVPFGKKDEPDKWITLRAVRMLKNHCSL